MTTRNSTKTARSVPPELRDMPPHHAAIALLRYEALQMFWVLDEERQGQDRCGTRREVVGRFREKHPKFPCSRASIERWELCWKSFGLAGLAGVRGYRHKGGVSIDNTLKRRFARLPLSEAASELGDLLKIIGHRLAEKESSRGTLHDTDRPATGDTGPADPMPCGAAPEADG